MFAGCWQIMPVYSHLIRVEGVGYWQLIRAEKMAVCRSCGLYLQAATPTDQSAMKVVYLAIEQAAKKWSMPIRDWKPALNQFMILYEDRFPEIF